MKSYISWGSNEGEIHMLAYEGCCSVMVNTQVLEPVDEGFCLLKWSKSTFRATNFLNDLFYNFIDQKQRDIEERSALCCHSDLVLISTNMHITVKHFLLVQFIKTLINNQHGY